MPPFAATALLVLGGGTLALGGVLASQGRDGARTGVGRRRLSAQGQMMRNAAIGGVLGGGAALTAAVLLEFGLGLALLACILGAIIGALLPKAYATRRTERRLREADNAVADFAGLLSVELRSGLGVDAALENVTGELSGVLVDEMVVANTQVSLGMPRERALELLHERLPVHNVERLAQALQHAGELGAPVADTLDLLSEDCTTRRFQQVREEAAKLPVKILFPILFCIFPPMLILLAGPAMVDIAEALG